MDTGRPVYPDEVRDAITVEREACPQAIRGCDRDEFEQECRGCPRLAQLVDEEEEPEEEAGDVVPSWHDRY